MSLPSIQNLLHAEGTVDASSLPEPNRHRSFCTVRRFGQDSVEVSNHINRQQACPALRSDVVRTRRP